MTGWKPNREHLDLNTQGRRNTWRLPSFCPPHCCSVSKTEPASSSFINKCTCSDPVLKLHSVTSSVLVTFSWSRRWMKWMKHENGTEGLSVVLYVSCTLYTNHWWVLQTYFKNRMNLCFASLPAPPFFIPPLWRSFAGVSQVERSQLWLFLLRDVVTCERGLISAECPPGCFCDPPAHASPITCVLIRQPLCHSQVQEVVG